MLIYIVGAALLLIVFGKYFLLIYGKEFEASYIPLIILIGGQLISSFVLNYCSGFMKMNGNRTTLILIYFLSTMLSLLLNYFLIPSLGITGAAFSTSISLIAMSLVIYFMALRNVKRSF